MLDIPFGLGLPNGGYTVFDPVKRIALFQPTLKEGSRTFFRNQPIIGPTSFNDLRRKAREYERPRAEYSATDAWNVLENDPDYEGVAKRLKRLESHTKAYCDQNGLSCAQYVGGTLYNRWRDILAHRRNRAVHAGVASFTWAEAAEAIGIAKESIVLLDQRVPALANPVQLNPSVTGLRESAGGILF
jgi:hypothetical protein